MDSNLKGNIGEAAAIKYFIENGYEVYLPFGTATKCDLVVLKDNEVFRVSVKTTSTKAKSGKWVVRIRQGKLNAQIPFSKESSDILFIYILPENRSHLMFSKDINTGHEVRID